MALNDSCRTCLRTASEKTFITEPVFETDSPSMVILDLLKSLPRLNFTEGRNYPVYICDICTNEVQRIYSFILQCEQTEEILKKINDNQLKAECEDHDETDKKVKTEQLLTFRFPSTASTSKHKRRKKFHDSASTSGALDNSSDSKSELLPDCLVDVKTEIEETRKTSKDYGSTPKVPANSSDSKSELFLEDIKTEVEEIHIDDVPDEIYSSDSSSDTESHVVNMIQNPQIELDTYEDFTSDTQDSDVQIIEEPDAMKKDDNSILYSMLRTSAKIPKTSYVCPECGLEFYRLGAFHKHLAECVNEGDDCIKYNCDICFLPFQSVLDLRDHFKKIHHRNGACVDDRSRLQEYECDLCFNNFSDRSSLMNHFEKMHPQGQLTLANGKDCVIIDVDSDGDTKSQEQFLVHRLNSRQDGSPNKFFKCPYCSAEFQFELQLNNHLIGHDRPHVCKFCSQTFKSKYFLTKHHENEHGLRRLYQTVKNETNVITSPLQLYECDICLIAFPNKASVLEHIEKMHPNGSFLLANEKDGDSMELENGSSDDETLSQMKNYRLFRDNYKISNHKRFVCVYCPKQFKTESRLSGHLRTHATNGKHNCNECRKIFRTSHHLKAHNMRVHGMKWKTIECGVCKKFFACKADLVRHQLTHTKEKPYLCKFCPEKYRYKRFLENHMRESHPITEDELQAYMLERYGSVRLELQLDPTFTCNVCDMKVDRSMLAEHVNSHKVQKK